MFNEGSFFNLILWIISLHSQSFVVAKASDGASSSRGDTVADKAPVEAPVEVVPQTPPKPVPRAPPSYAQIRDALLKVSWFFLSLPYP